MTDFEDIGFNGLGVGSLSLGDESLTFNDMSSGLSKTIEQDEISNCFWTLFGMNGHLKLQLKSDEIVRLEGFSKGDLEDLSTHFSVSYNKDIEPEDISSVGHNCGDVKVDDAQINFFVEDQKAFEIPLDTITQCVVPRTAKNNEVELQFSEVETMGGNEDCLIEMRLGFTHNIKMEEEEEEDEEDGEITTPAHSFHSLIMQSAPMRSGGGEERVVELPFDICTFSIPRGRYGIEMYDSFMRLHGASYDHKVRWEDVEKAFKLPLPTGSHDAVLISLKRPVRQGKQRYANIILNATTTQTTIPLSNTSLSEDELKEKYEGKINQVMTGPFSVLVSKYIKYIGKKSVFVPDTFKSLEENNCVATSLGSNEGLLYFLTRSLIFIHKPTLIIAYNQIDHISFLRLHSSSQSFDLKIIMKMSRMSSSSSSSSNEVLFKAIRYDEVELIKNFLDGKKVTIIETSAPSTSSSSSRSSRVLDQFNEEMKMMDADGLSDDDEEEEDDDYVNSSSSSDSGQDSDNSVVMVDEDEGDEESQKNKRRKKKKRKRRSSPSKKSESKKTSKKNQKKGKKKKKKKKKDPNKPKAGKSSFFFFSMENRPKLKEKNPELPFGELSKLVGVKWKELTADDKHVFEEKAVEDKKRYKKEMESYVPPPSSSSSSSSDQASSPSDSDQDDEGDNDQSKKKKRKKPSSPSKKEKQKYENLIDISSPSDSSDDDDG